jgi:glycosyltransferase involved in cell wall biosynthesis
MIRVLHVTYSDGLGGADRAAWRTHSALKRAGCDSVMRVRLKQTDDTTLVGGLAAGQSPWRQRLQDKRKHWKENRFHCTDDYLLDCCWPSSGLGRELGETEADLVHFHWIGKGLISIEEIGSLRKPIAWTLHDMWPFHGAEYYGPLDISRNQRFREGYTKHNRPANERGFDLNRWTWERKKQHWQRQISLICPSAWMAEQAASSLLMGGWPSHVIPNTIDTDSWKPIDKRIARSLLGLPKEKKLILFGANNAISDPRKGGDLLIRALRELKNLDKQQASNMQAYELVVFGAAKTEQTLWPYPTHCLGTLHDDISLQLIYSACDVFVLSSRLDNLPNTGIEAHACGLPIAAFDAGGIRDIVTDRQTGMLATPEDTQHLANGIHWVLENEARHKNLSATARLKAVKEWSYPVHAWHMQATYQSVLAEYQNTAKKK